MIKFSIVITTKNRILDLKKTLISLKDILERTDVELLICDDASTDGTQLYLQESINDFCILNKKSKGLIYNRNVLNNLAKGLYIISLDDDANFLSNNPLEEIESYFINEENCAVISFSIFWGVKKPRFLTSSEKPIRVSSFVGCGHAWRKKYWLAIAEYPSWFVFYGEEDFASYHLFKKGLEVHYNPKVLVHHRVDVKARKKNKDYGLRLRRSFRSVWYLYFLFLPLKEIPRRLCYTFWIQLKNKTFKGDFKATIGIFLAVFDVFYNSIKLIKNSNRLNTQEFKEYKDLPKAILYWKPERK